MSQKKETNIVRTIMIAMVLGLAVGLVFMFLNSHLHATGREDVWDLLYSVLLADITAEGQSGIGILYILSTVFLNAIQLAIIPLVLTSLILAMNNTSDIKKLGRIAYKTVGLFFLMYAIGCVFSGGVAAAARGAGLFSVKLEDGGVMESAGISSVNPIITLVTIVPKNITASFADNQAVLSVVFLAIVLGLCFNVLGDKAKLIKKLIEELDHVVHLYLTFVIYKLSPIAIFSMLVRALATYGVAQLKSVALYTLIAFLVLTAYLTVGYAVIVGSFTKLNPLIFLKKMAKVSMFAFSVDSSGATLPLNTKTVVEELGVKPEIANFVLPLGMTINMNGTAMQHMMATTFIATVAGYDMNLGSYIMIALLAIAFSAGAPAVPQVGAVMLFTVLTGMGFTNDMAMLTYSLVFAIKPLEMYLTALNVMGDGATAVIVAHSEHELDTAVYYGKTQPAANVK